MPNREPNDFMRRQWSRPGVRVALDLWDSGIEPKDFARWSPGLAEAIVAMRAIEAGAVANVDEQRCVGHYWLRDPELAPTDAIRADIQKSVADITAFARRVREGELLTPGGERFAAVVLVGIGGSALGPMLLADALAAPDSMPLVVIDNTDPQGLLRALAALPGSGSIASRLARSLIVVASKSGGTRETANGMRALDAMLSAQGLAFASQAVAITSPGSALDRQAVAAGFLARFAIWDWVGGRTSACSAVGLLPMALQGVDIQAFLDGARDMDAWTREAVATNPAAALALSWLVATEGEARRAMVVLPYRDRLLLWGRYLQQLVMESLGKCENRAGQAVHQGLAVYGNKGTTDQHAYVQQLREGPDDHFVSFVEVLRSEAELAPAAAPSDGSGEWGACAMGDDLAAFLHGTRAALSDVGRRSHTLVLEELSPRALGALIALYERAVGLYAEVLNLNAYHQPGVEAGKRAAASFLTQQNALLALLAEAPGRLETADSWSARLIKNADPGGDKTSMATQAVHRTLRRLAALGRIRAQLTDTGELVFGAPENS